jgi:decaprenylphospho-beta-D-ribofuranose 2-oxidase
MTFTATISGWGNYPKQEAQLLTPPSSVSLKEAVKLEGSLIARGMGRSYGDSANAPRVLQTFLCDHFVEFDEKTGRLTAESGVTLREILKLIVNSGWFLPITPGTSYVTLGGAIASDVHGKNHHIAGTFGQHITSIQVLLGTGDVVTASEFKNTDLFYATCGGMGLTGVIISATIQLLPIRSSYINQKTIKAGCIEEACEAFKINGSATYSVAWIDCLAKGRGLGRSILVLGEHAENDVLDFEINKPVSVPFNAPPALLNRLTMKTFNGAFWHKAKHNRTKTVPLFSYFYPLDAIGNWNKLYGKDGFLQFQCVIPKDNGIANMRMLLTEIIESGEVPFLSVLKQFGKGNNYYLSFPTEGYTLALDFKLTPSVITTLQRLEDIVVGMGGRIYLTKDALMQEATFKATYQRWEEFETVREKYGAIGKFSSAQSKRLGLG